MVRAEALHSSRQRHAACARHCRSRSRRRLPRELHAALRFPPAGRRSMPTALIAEDEPLLRAQLRSRLAEAWPELTIVGEAENGERALALIDEHKPDVAFLDIRMPLVS